MPTPLETLIHSAPAGATIALGPREIVLGEPLVIEGKHDLRLDLRGVVFRTAGRFTPAAITFRECHGLRIVGGKIQGDQTADGWLKIPAATAAENMPHDDVATFFAFDRCRDLHVADVRAAGVERLMRLDHCRQAIASGVSMEGVLAGRFDKTTRDEMRPFRHLWAVMVVGGQCVTLEHVHASDCAGAVLAGETPIKLSVEHVAAERLASHGVYLSSARFSRVSGVHVVDSHGTAAKARGDYNVIENCSALRCFTGFGVEGAAKQPDEYGASGHGSSIRNCQAVDCRRFGLWTDVEYDLLPRDVTIEGCYLKNCGQEGGEFSPVVVSGCDGLRFERNVIEGGAADYAVQIGAVRQAKERGPFERCVIAGNTILGERRRVRLVGLSSPRLADNTGFEWDDREGEKQKP